MTTYVATTARFAEPALVSELARHGIHATPTDRGAVTFEGDIDTAMRACLWSRIAGRVLQPLATVRARHADQLYADVRDMDWARYLRPEGTLAIQAVGTNPALRNSHFTTLRVKDAVCDRLRADRGHRPDIRPDDPDLRLHVFIDGASAQVAIDLSGDPLFRRGHFRDGGPAPLKETLAATILELAGWPALAPEGAALVDPMCGSGTFLTEAAGLALDRAPGLSRGFGFERLPEHDHDAYKALRDAAKARVRDELPGLIEGADLDGDQVTRARKNLGRADLAHLVKVVRRPWDRCEPPEGVREAVPHGLLVVNPPYGERLGERERVEALYGEIGDGLRRKWLGWVGYVLAGDTQLAKKVGLRPTRRIPLYNGPLDCRLLEIPIATHKVERDQ